MKRTLSILALALAVGMIHAQSTHKKPVPPFKAPDWAPMTCKVGDVTDSYGDNWLMCPSPNKWEKFKSSAHLVGGWINGAGTLCSGDCRMVPNCRLAFADDAGNDHCPYETATGRVVACEPCKKNDEYCARWFRECTEFVAFQKSHETAEPTRVSVSTIRSDHTESGDYACPDEFALHWISKTHAYSTPICAKPR